MYINIFWFENNKKYGDVLSFRFLCLIGTKTAALFVDSSGAVANVWDSDILLSEFELQLHYCVHFQINTLEKSMNPLIPPSIG